MNTLKVEQAVVSIRMVKVGEKTMTKAVFEQIPNREHLLETDTVLGYISCWDKSRYCNKWYLVVDTDGELSKLARDRVPIRPSSFEAENIRCRIELRDYDEWVAKYRFFYKMLSPAKQLYISV